MSFVIISISIYNFGIYLILVLSNCNAIQSTDCHVRCFNKLSIYLSINSVRDSIACMAGVKRGKGMGEFGRAREKGKQPSSFLACALSRALIIPSPSLSNACHAG